MSSETKLVGKNSRVFDYIGGGPRVAFLRYRVGVVYPTDKAPDPQNISNMVPLPPPAGAAQKKFYCPAQGVDLLEASVVEYPIPESVGDAPQGELFLSQHGGYVVWFGRSGQKRPFSFSWRMGRYSMPIWINRIEDGGFPPLFVSARKGDVVKYCVLEVEWNGGTIAVSVHHVAEQDAPEFLRFRRRDAEESPTV